MIELRAVFILLLVLFLGGCFSRNETKSAPEASEGTELANSIVQKKDAAGETGRGNSSGPGQGAGSVKDKSLATLTRYFAQADGIHKEAWWVLTSERRPAGKSPFGKVERALMSSENIKLSNKSLFRCDRYVVKRSILSPSGYPQKAEVSEKCSDKIPAKKIADLHVPKEGEVQVIFYPENLEEILGLGPTILNKQIECTLKASESGVLTSLQCKNWSQDRSKEQMVRLDTYDYQKDGKNLIKLRGKIYENLSDTRKIEADVPLDGKILVTETELYPPEGAKPTPTPAKKADGKSVVRGSAESGTPTAPPGGSVPTGAPDTPAADPDLIQGRFQAAPVQSGPQQQPVQVEQVPASPADQGWPVDEQGNPLPAGNPLVPAEQMQPLHETTPEELTPQGAPVPQGPVLQTPPAEGVPHGR